MPEFKMEKLYRPWYERYPERFNEEIKDMEAKGFVLNREVLDSQHMVEFTGTLPNYQEVILTVKYPDSFPSCPPRVYTDASGQILSRHHHPVSGEICSFGPNQARWMAGLSGATVLDEAEQVIQLNSTFAGEDEVPEPRTTLYNYARDAAILVSPGIAGFVRSLSGKETVGTVRLRFSRQNNAPQPLKRGIILECTINGVTTKAEPPFNEWCQGGQEHVGALFCASTPPPVLAKPEQYRRWLQGLKGTAKLWNAFVFPEQSGSSRSQRLSWVLMRTLNPNKADLVRVFTLGDDGRETRIPGMAGLGGKTVTIVGCGCLGSKIAVSLAATGVKRIYLVDPDIIEPDNALRHEVGVEYFGIPKVFALAYRVMSVNPQCDVEPLVFRVGAINSAEQERQLFNLIAGSDLIVEATGVHAVSNFVNSFCHDFNIPSVYVTVTNGAWGGEVVRVIPRVTPCWVCWFTQYERQTPSGAPSPEVGVYAPGCDQPTFTGTTYETGLVANLASWMVCETLLRSDQGRNDFEGDYIRWTARDSTGVPAPAIEVLPVQKRDNCPRCN